MELFWCRGYEATSLQSLLTTMDISKSSFYQAFGSKHELFERCLMVFRERQVGRMTVALEQAPSGKAFLRAMLLSAAREASSDEPPKGCLIMNTATEFSGRDAVVADLVEQGVDEANQLQQDVSDLTKQVANLTDALKADGTDGTDSTQNQGKDSSNVDSSLMLPALSGSGVTVTLDDSPLWENAVNNNGTTANINDYVIHQQDVESVVNALWAGGADALMIMDQRVLFNSAVICSGNVLSLHGKKYSPPFTISAIGDPQRLRAALNDSEAITILKQYVTAFGIGYKVENAEDLQFPATAALLQQLKYATVDTSKTTDEEQTQQ